MSSARARARAAAGRARHVLGKARNRLRPDVPAGVANGEFTHWVTVNTMHNELLAGDFDRPNYIWSMLHVADIARYRKIPRLSVIEFGVAGGNGLVALDRLSSAVRELLDVQVDVYGFDTGAGLPPPKDQRDAPFIMDPGDFPMDEQKLRARLDRAELVLGLVEDTIPAFLARTPAPAPIAFISFDLDYYSSSVAALKVFDAPADLLFPRILCYFDDVLGYPWSDCNGARLAISEFNAGHGDRNVSHLPGMRYLVPSGQAQARWVDSMYLAHIFDHPNYNDDEGTALMRRLDLA